LRLISASHRDGQRLSGLVEKSQLPQPTVHRLLKQLIEGGLVMQDADRRYRLGHFAYELGLAAGSHFGLRQQCAPHLARISQETGDSAFLVVRSGCDSFCLDRQSGAFPIQVLTMEVGKRRPLGIGGGGLALLSFLPEAELPGVLSRIEPHLKSYGGLTRSILLELLAQARERGYAAITDYAVAGVTSIGVPIYGRTGQVLGAVSVSAITARMVEREAVVVRIMQREVEALQVAQQQSQQSLAGRELRPKPA
jgi:DNA-binding IclR family transcriptional regulator